MSLRSSAQKLCSPKIKGPCRSIWNLFVGQNDSATYHPVLYRRFSSPQLRRPPPARQSDQPREVKSTWRTHAVNLSVGDYSEETRGVDLVSGEQTLSYDWEVEEEMLSEEAKTLENEEEAQRKRWMENAAQPRRKPMIDDLGRAYGRGGRKAATARVWVQPGLGHVVVNTMDFVDYFDRATDREKILAPLVATATCGEFDVTATVTGGGLTGQAGAIRHGLARALNNYNPDMYRPPLKRLGFLTRDPRKVERKKVGHLKARKKPQWVKR